MKRNNASNQMMNNTMIHGANFAYLDVFDGYKVHTISLKDFLVGNKIQPEQKFPFRCNQRKSYLFENEFLREYFEDRFDVREYYTATCMNGNPEINMFYVFENITTNNNGTRLLWPRFTPPYKSS